MDDTTLQEIIRQQYAVPDAQLDPIIVEDWRQLHRVEGVGSAPWLMRAYSHPNSDHRQARLVQVLELLAATSFPAPRLIPTASGRTAVEAGQWHMVMTTFVQGDVLTDNGPAALRQLGEALGQLHTLSASWPPAVLQALPIAGWTPTSQFVPFALQEMEATAALVSPALQATYEEILQALHSLPPMTDLPQALLHNDCVPTNAVVTPEGRLVLIDWADAGRGPMLIDLAWLLLQCDDGKPQTPLPPTDLERLYAVMEGYCRYRVPTRAETEAMLPALRFVSTVWSGLEFSAALRGESSEHSWEWWWARYHAAAAIAPLVQEWLAKAVPKK